MNFRESVWAGMGEQKSSFLPAPFLLCWLKDKWKQILGRKITAWYLRLRIQSIVFLLFKLILRDGSRDKELI